jgi:hypothetical protein
VNREESLIIIRAHEVIALLLEMFPRLSAIELYNQFDIDLLPIGRWLLLKAELPQRRMSVISEKYRYLDYQLAIFYDYSLLGAQGEPIISFDNSPHHPTLTNFPHHKHYYPKAQHTPLSFSGRLADALHEIQWITTVASP